MGKKSILMVSLAIVLALVVGFIVGLFVEYPKVDSSEFAGTIGKVSNYRNTKATEADIELRNALLSDEKTQQSVSAYMAFYYTKSNEFGQSIVFALEQAKADKAFADQYPTQIEALEKYATFLETTRKDLLLTTLICQSVEESTPEMLRNAIAQSNNIIAQMNYRNSTVIVFIESLDDYILKAGTTVNENLNQAHDLLVLNQKRASTLTKDKVLMKYFENKQLFAKEVKPAPMNIKANMIKDIEKLNAIFRMNMEKLGCATAYDQEKLGSVNDTEELGGMNLLNDVEKLEGFWYTDVEELGTGFSDTEVLGVIVSMY